MARKHSRPQVVAELGRPETEEETIARKAENSRQHRQRQTVNNLVLSLVASLGVVLLIVLAVPRGTGNFEDRSVDVVTLANQASPSAGQQLIAPDLDDSWKAKQAELRSSTSEKITHWYVGYTTPNNQYAAVLQAFTPESLPANETWVIEQLERKKATGSEQLAGLTWSTFDYQDQSGDGTNVRFGLTTNLENSALVVYGTDEPDAIRQLAVETVESLRTP